MSLYPEIDVKGVASTLRALNKIDPVLAKTTRRRIKQAANPMVQDIRRFVPTQAPLSGMARNWEGGRLKWSSRARSGVRANQGQGRKRVRNGYRIDLLKIVQSNPAGAVFDMAGKRGGKNDQGRRMIEQLTARHGAPSRSMWKSEAATLQKTEKAIKSAIADLSAEINKLVGKV